MVGDTSRHGIRREQGAQRREDSVKRGEEHRESEVADREAKQQRGGEAMRPPTNPVCSDNCSALQFRARGFHDFGRPNIVGVRLSMLDDLEDKVSEEHSTVACHLAEKGEWIIDKTGRPHPMSGGQYSE